MNRAGKVAFITGASRGIGAATAVQLACAGFDVALTARTLEEQEAHEYGSEASRVAALPGSLRTTARLVEQAGREALCLRSDILEPPSVSAAIEQTLAHFGRIDLLFNNACYQGPGNMQRLSQVSAQHIHNIYQGNVFTPLLAVQQVLPDMVARGSGTIINMASGSAVNNPPAPADEGGWGFAYPGSKAALMRMVPSLRVEYPGAGFRFFNVEPGFVYTDVMRLNGLGEEQAKRFQPQQPDAIARAICWLATAPQAMALHHKNLIHLPGLLARI